MAATREIGGSAVGLAPDMARLAFLGDFTSSLRFMALESGSGSGMLKGLKGIGARL
jgi:hypothetical protein